MPTLTTKLNQEKKLSIGTITVHSHCITGNTTDGKTPIIANTPNISTIERPDWDFKFVMFKHPFFICYNILKKTHIGGRMLENHKKQMARLIWHRGLIHRHPPYVFAHCGLQSAYLFKVACTRLLFNRFLRPENGTLPSPFRTFAHFFANCKNFLLING